MVYFVLDFHFSSSGAEFAYNARLRGEQRNYQLTAQHLNHKNKRITKMPRVANPSLTVCYTTDYNFSLNSPH
ncbi:hypothetical protein FKQ60_16350 [Vibrio sp. A11]|nr:hypothetical protein [Vibrio sp. A11]